MPALSFHKYQGTGNDFIMIDDRARRFDSSRTDLISGWCDRKFGIGADGLILIRDHDEYDFEMVYFNPDGSQSLCGNGSRCAVRFAASLGIIGDSCTFLAVDGTHEGYVEGEMIRIKIHDADAPKSIDGDFFIDTGSPHHIRLVDQLDAMNIVAEGRKIRYRPDYQPHGTNVNFVQPQNGSVLVRTYERGVEDETLSCGTGVTASALVMALQGFESPIRIKALGGLLQVSFTRTPDGGFREVYLTGPAEKVFEGVIRY